MAAASATAVFARGRMCAAVLALWATPVAAETQAQHFPPLESRAIKQYPGCPGGPGKALPARAIDLSAPADDELLDKAWASGVRFVIRYYDWPEVDGKDHPGQCMPGPRTAFNRHFEFPWKPGPTLPAKSLTPDEIRRLHAKGFGIGIVFQHCNQRLATFLDRTRAAFDARVAMDLAHRLAQPSGTTIFFAADFDAAPPNIARIQRYFRTIGPAIKRRGYRLGGYGNGYVCDRLKADGLIESCWLSQSTGFLGSRAYQVKGAWDLQQCATRAAYRASGVHFDPNIVNPRRSAIGWWRPR